MATETVEPIPGQLPLWGDVREIPLTRGLVGLVDEADWDAYDLGQGYKWRASKLDWGTHYILRSKRRPDGRWTTEYMHSLLLPDAEMVDHVNGNGLDNRRANLRPATNTENQRNRRGPQVNNTSGFLGVIWHKRDRKWRARIKVDGRYIDVGYFDDPEEAARVRDKAAIELFGEYHGHLNFPDEHRG